MKTEISKLMTSASSFLAGMNGKSVIIGAPPNFDFVVALRNAVWVKGAIAFGHMSGWKKISAALTNSSAASVEILLGQAFFQTEPDLLDCLYELGQQKRSFRARLASANPTFHPKVWIIGNSAATHMIIGSANLSGGGFIKNTECSAYLGSLDSSASVDTWFRELWDESRPLDPNICRSYREQYNHISFQRRKLQEAIDEATQHLEQTHYKWRRAEAIKEARSYFKTSDGILAKEGRLEAMDRIAKCLKPKNNFDFSKDDWLEFLRIPEFGSLNRIKRDTANHLPAIKTAFRHLADEKIPLATRVDQVVPPGSSYHVNHIGKNIATKIMAMLWPKGRPVYNTRVEETLRAFGYAVDLPATFGNRYEVFCKAAKSFAIDCGFEEVLSIDAFFEYYSRKD